jgi:HlyD family secretion protein
MKKIIFSLGVGVLGSLIIGCGNESNNLAIKNSRGFKSNLSSGIVQNSKEFILKSVLKTPELKLTGNIEPEKEVPISAKISGRIDKLNFEIGDFVKKGQILVRYSTLNDANQVAYNNALRDFKMTQHTAKSQIETSSVALESARRQLEQLEKQQSVEKDKAFINLKNLAQNSQVDILNFLSFMDRQLGASPKYDTLRVVGRYEIGGKDRLMKNELIDKLDKQVRNFDKNSQNLNSNLQTDIYRFALKRLKLLQEVKTSLLDFNYLVKNSFTNNNFTENMRKSLDTQVEQSLVQISGKIMGLEAAIKSIDSLDSQIKLNLVAAENQLKNAEASYQLAKSNSSSLISASRSALNIAGNYQKEMIIKAPFDGVITQKFVEEGQLAGAGTMFARLADISGYKIKTAVPDRFVGKISENFPVKIKVEGIAEGFTGKITKINPQVDLMTRKLGLEITLDRITDDQQKIYDEVKDIEEKAGAVLVETSDIENLNFVKKYKKLKLGLFSRLIITLPEEKTFVVPRNFVKATFQGNEISVCLGTSATLNEKCDFKKQLVNVLKRDKNLVEIFYDGIGEDQILREF